MWLSPARQAQRNSRPHRGGRLGSFVFRPRKRQIKYTKPTTAAASIGTPRKECVNPRWWAKPKVEPRKKLPITSRSGASAASVSVSVASAVLRLSPARPRHAPVRKWVMGSKRSRNSIVKRFGEVRQARSARRGQQRQRVRHHGD